MLLLNFCTLTLISLQHFWDFSYYLKRKKKQTNKTNCISHKHNLFWLCHLFESVPWNNNNYWKRDVCSLCVLHHLLLAVNIIEKSSLCVNCGDFWVEYWCGSALLWSALPSRPAGDVACVKLSKIITHFANVHILW